MTSLDKLSASPVVKALCVGYPGSGKTGSLAALANAGYKLRILDFDDNFDPLVAWIEPEFHKNVDIVTLKDRMIGGKKRMETQGKPTALMGAQDLLNRWKYKDEDGNEVDLGAPSKWGPDTVLVLDSLTAMGDAVMNWVLFIQDRVVKGPRKSDWGVAQGFQKGLVEKLMSRDQVGCHTILTAHLKMIGPPDFEADDDDEVKKDKEKVRQLVSYKLFPSALGRALPPEIAKHCPYVLLYETNIVAGRVRRMIKTIPNLAFDGVAVPLKDIPAELSIEDGLAKLFGAVGGGKGENKHD